MPQIPIQVRKQLTQLGKIPSREAENASAVIVDVKIKDLSVKDLQRALYVIGNSFIELTHKQKVIVDVIKETQKKVEEALNDTDLNREELELTIRNLVLEEIKPETKIETKSDVQTLV